MRGLTALALMGIAGTRIDDTPEGSDVAGSGASEPIRSGTLYKCNTCPPGAEFHPKDKFASDTKGKNGIKSKCRACTSAADKLRKASKGKAPAPAAEPAPKPAKAPKGKPAPKPAKRKGTGSKIKAKPARKAPKGKGSKRPKVRAPSAQAGAGKTARGGKRKNAISASTKVKLSKLYDYMQAKPRTAREVAERFKCSKPASYIRIRALESLGVKFERSERKDYSTGPAAEVLTMSKGKKPEALA